MRLGGTRFFRVDERMEGVWVSDSAMRKGSATNGDCVFCGSRSVRSRKSCRSHTVAMSFVDELEIRYVVRILSLCRAPFAKLK